jgi:heat shock protein HtpX
MAKRIILFVLVNILVMVTISIVVSLLGVGGYVGAAGLDYGALFVFCLVWGMGGAFISLLLSRIMAKMMLGVKVIDTATTNPEERWLVDTVHRLATQAKLPMPEVGWYESEEVNAFATGPSKSRALVAVSSGLMSRMSREQVEGVLGHELTHVANGDMVTMTLIQGVVNAFVMFIARIIAFFVSQSMREEWRAMTNLIVTIVMQIALSLLGMMVVAWFSREREFRADAGGANLAGRGKMIGALEALKRTTELVDTEQQSLATLKIASKPGSVTSLFATHPPLDVRIEALKRGAAA